MFSDETRQKRRSTRRQYLRLTGGAAIAGLAGCTGGGGSGDSDSGDGGTTGSGSGGGPPEKPDELVVRSYGGVWLEGLKAAVKGFEEDTGISIQYTQDPARETDNKIIQASEQDRKPPVNVQWTIPNWSFRVWKNGAVEPLDADIVTNTKDLHPYLLPDEVTSKWPYAPIFFNTYGLGYNTDLVDTEPSSFEELWKPKWESSVATYDTGSGFIPAVAELTGTELAKDMPPVWDKIRELRPNLGLVGGDSKITTALRRGDVAFAVYLSPNVVEARNQDAPLDLAFPKEGLVAKTNDIYSPAGQDESHAYWAQKYINRVISPEGQSRWVDVLPVTPTNSKATVTEYMKDNPVFPSNPDDFDGLITVPVDKVGEWVDTWSQEWTKAISQ